MIHIGVDFGTTNSVVAVTDETGCQVVQHRLTSKGRPEIVEPVFPSLIGRSLDDPDQLVYGLSADAVGRRASSHVRRSLKRELCTYFESKNIDVAGSPHPLKEMLTNLLIALRHSTLDSLELSENDKISIVATVPANANGAQRWITRKAFLDAGWSKHIRLIDEPTAAALEFVGRAFRRRRGKAVEPTTILIYDLGGGTFDASLVQIRGENVEVLSNGGIWKLGGDDFDQELENLVAEILDLDISDLTELQKRNLRGECRRAKESLSAYPALPRRFLVSLGDLGIQGKKGSDARVPVREYRKRIQPHLDSALEVVEEVLESHPYPPDRVYLVGGSTLLPFVGESLAPKFPVVVRGNRPFE